MKADTLQLLGDLIGSNKVLFRIPVYQRNYDWSEENCNRLLDDIRDIIYTGEKHFLGTIVYMAIDSNDFVLHDYIVIDGQQRLTTTMILLKALYDLAEKQEENSIMDDINDYLKNRNCPEEYKIKLKPIKTDDEQFSILLNDTEKIDMKGHIGRNYEICKQRMSSWIEKEKISLEKILRALTRLEVVGIALKQNEDDPQIIFESLNSTGLELSNADLIRNFLLMNAAEQNKLFENYWLPIEQSLKRNTDYSDLNMFFNAYVVFKINRVVNEKALYHSFVKLFKDKGFTHESCLKELKYFANIFKNFVSPENSNYSQKIKRSLQSLKLLKHTTCFPFLLHVFDDYHNGVIDQFALEKTVQFVLTYVFRRSICGTPTNSLRGLFAYLYGRVFKVVENKNKYYESVNKFLSTVFSDDIMPSETECRNALIDMNLYTKSSLCRFIMMEIENGDKKEVLKDDNLTIEHIMPQMLTVEWSKVFSEKDHETYLHTLGNLTITGYNSELSNKSFKEKKDIIKMYSKAVVLNQDILDKDIWTVDDIKNRSRRLTKILLDMYKVEKINDPFITFEYTTKISLKDDSHMVIGKKLISFTFKGETYLQRKYAQMLLDVIKLLDEENPKKLQELADNSFVFRKSIKGYVHISNNSENLYRPLWIRDNLFVEGNFSSASIFSFIKALMKEYNIDDSLFYISVASEEIEDEDNEDL